MTRVTEDHTGFEGKKSELPSQFQATRRGTRTFFPLGTQLGTQLGRKSEHIRATSGILEAETGNPAEIRS
jgi:hypothetical protein